MMNNPTIAAFYAAYNAHDADAATALYVSDGRHDEIAMGNSRSGHAALQEGLNGFFGMLPDVHWTTQKVIKSADWLAVSYRMTGTFTPRKSDDAAAASPPRSVAIDGLHMIKMRGDAIEITQDYWDKDDFLSQIR